MSDVIPSDVDFIRRSKLEELQQMLTSLRRSKVIASELKQWIAKSNWLTNIRRMLSPTIRLAELKKQRATFSDATVTALSWKRLPRPKNEYSEAYQFLYWISMGAGRKIFQSLFEFIERRATRSNTEIRVEKIERHVGQIKFGREAYSLPTFVTEQDIATRLEAEGFSVSMNEDNRKIRVSW